MLSQKLELVVFLLDSGLTGLSFPNAEHQRANVDVFLESPVQVLRTEGGEVS